MAGGGATCSSLLRGFLSLFFLMFLHIGGHAGCCFSPGSASQQPVAAPGIPVWVFMGIHFAKIITFLLKFVTILSKFVTVLPKISLFCQIMGIPGKTGAYPWRRHCQQHEEEDYADGKGTGVGSSSKRRKISPLAFSPAASSSTVVGERARARRRRVSSLATDLRCYLHRVFSSSGAKNAVPAAEEEEAVTTTAAQSVTQRPPSVVLSTPSSPCASPFLSPMSPRSLGVTPVPCSPPQATTRRLSRSFAARGDLFPCKVCGEVLSKLQQLELHQAMKHSLSELSHADSSMNIIRMIFLAGWPSSDADADPAVRRILRIHHNPRALSRFEEYRDLVRARAVRRYAASGAGAVQVEERCIADGNERLRFHCSTMLCSLGAGGVCGSPYCCTCTILRHGFAGKQADVDGIATYSSGRAAHASLPEDVEREFAFLQVRRAMLVCRVVAGRVVHGHGGAAGDDDKVAYDSMVPVPPAGGGRRGEDDAELLVFNPRAVLPCFVILYSS